MSDPGNHLSPKETSPIAPMLSRADLLKKLTEENSDADRIEVDLQPVYDAVLPLIRESRRRSAEQSAQLAHQVVGGRIIASE